MPEFQLSPGVAMFYRDDDCTDPWRTPETVLMLHGFAESGLAWNGWMPHFARRFRVIRPDMRGFGRSTPMPVDYPWTIDGIIDDFMRLVDHLGVERFHVVAAKSGGAFAIRLAATHPGRVLTLTGAEARTISGDKSGPVNSRGSDLQTEFERSGIEGWARSSMPGRLGRHCSPELFEGWIKLMSATPISTAIGFTRMVPGVDLTADLPRVTCPTLLISNEEVGAPVLAAIRARLALIPRAELLVLPGDSTHVAATDPQTCARITLSFIDRV
jgi:3-oxoadipate enol-lactonase